MIRFLQKLGRAREGVSAVEFGLIAPLMIGLSLGSLELAFDVWAKSVLNGAVQQAGRDSGLEDSHSDQRSVDEYVTQQVNSYLPTATLSFQRKNYENFSDVGTPEDFTDSNHNGQYDEGECFDDENDNQQWDADSAMIGQGGARDVVVYTAKMKYHELLPMSAFIGLPGDREFSATTTLMNQPFSTQADRVIKEICPPK